MNREGNEAFTSHHAFERQQMLLEFCIGFFPYVQSMTTLGKLGCGMQYTQRTREGLWKHLEAIIS
jgi:hypothetical protein